MKFLLILLLVSCSTFRDRTPASRHSLLVWSEEFDVDGAPDPALWDYDTDYVRNNEAQCYTNDRAENVRVKNGFLILEARKEKFSCDVPGVRGKIYDYTSGSIRTRKRNAGPVLRDMTFGRYEIRAKIPTARGTWPAIWMVGIAPGLHWPQAGEIDIMEVVGFEPSSGLQRVHSTLHKDPEGARWPVPNKSIYMTHHHDLNSPLGDDFHVYRVDWSPSRIEFFVDGIRVDQRTVGNKIEKKNAFLKSEVDAKVPGDWPYGREIPGQQFFMILNLAIGGGWGGQKGIDDTMFERGKVQMLVDYVRVYELNSKTD